MIPKSGEKSHDKGNQSAVGDISETVFYRGAMSEVPSIVALAVRVCPPKMWLPRHGYRLSNGAVPVCPVPTSDLNDGGDGATQNPYAAGSVVPGILSGVLGQMGYFCCKRQIPVSTKKATMLSFSIVAKFLKSMSAGSPREY